MVLFCQSHTFVVITCDIDILHNNSTYQFNLLSMYRLNLQSLEHKKINKIHNISCFGAGTYFISCIRINLNYFAYTISIQYLSFVWFTVS